MPEVVEGRTRLFPPPGNLDRATRAPGTRHKGQPFYNPGMDLNRDLSVLLVAAEAARKGRELDVGDALAGTGARSLRIAHEVEAPLVVHANDGSALAVQALRQGAHANGIPQQRLAVREGDAHTFLASRRFDVVDIDPYGSPMPFLDAAVRATRHEGLVCVTATDTGALAGAFPKACRRRYDAHHGLNGSSWRAEVGLRILGGAVVRAAARFDRVATPVLSVSHGHWMRVVARVDDGKKDADAALRRLANAEADPATGNGRFVPLGRPVEAAWAGPLWSGPLHDAALVRALSAASVDRVLAAPKDARRLLPLLLDEADAPAFWIVPDLLQGRLGPPSARRDPLMARLRAAGHPAHRSHLDPQAIRTDAALDSLAALWLDKTRP